MSTRLGEQVPADWQKVLAQALAAPGFAALDAFLATERREHSVYPPADEVFAAYAHTPFDAVRVVLLGQDPYHGEGQAHGLCFSVRPGVKVPPSLRNVFKERQADLKMKPPPHGDLRAWARGGMLLLNTVLSVRAGEANSHRTRGWEGFTDATIDALVARARPCVFVLWGAPARKKAARIPARHRVVQGPHPSPLSAHRGFFGSRPFSAVNEALRELGEPAFDWSLD